MNPLNLLRAVRLARLARRKDEEEPPTALESFAPTYLKIMGTLLLILIALGAILILLQELNLLVPLVRLIR